MKKQERKNKACFTLKGFKRFLAKYLRKKLIDLYSGKEYRNRISGMDLFRKKARRDPRYIPAMFHLLCAYTTDAFLLKNQKEQEKALWSLWYYLQMDLHRYRAVLPLEIRDYTNLLMKALLPSIMLAYKKSLLQKYNFKDRQQW